MKSAESKTTLTSGGMNTLRDNWIVESSPNRVESFSESRIFAHAVAVIKWKFSCIHVLKVQWSRDPITDRNNDTCGLRNEEHNKQLGMMRRGEIIGFMYRSRLRFSAYSGLLALHLHLPARKSRTINNQKHNNFFSSSFSQLHLLKIILHEKRKT